MASRALRSDAPWRASARAVPLVTGPTIARVPRTKKFQYAVSVLKHPDPIGGGLALEAVLEAAGPDCLVPGQEGAIRVMGVQVWPLELPNLAMKDLLGPIGRELQTISKVAEKAIDLMNAPLGR